MNEILGETMSLNLKIAVLSTFFAISCGQKPIPIEVDKKVSREKDGSEKVEKKRKTTNDESTSTKRENSRGENSLSSSKEKDKELVETFFSNNPDQQKESNNTGPGSDNKNFIRSLEKCERPVYSLEFKNIKNLKDKNFDGEKHLGLNTYPHLKKGGKVVKLDSINEKRLYITPKTKNTELLLSYVTLEEDGSLFERSIQKVSFQKLKFIKKPKNKGLFQYSSILPFENEAFKSDLSVNFGCLGNYLKKLRGKKEINLTGVKELLNIYVDRNNSIVLDQKMGEEEVIDRISSLSIKNKTIREVFFSHLDVVLRDFHDTINKKTIENLLKAISVEMIRNENVDIYERHLLTLTKLIIKKYDKRAKSRPLSKIVDILYRTEKMKVGAEILEKLLYGQDDLLEKDKRKVHLLASGKYESLIAKDLRKDSFKVITDFANLDDHFFKDAISYFSEKDLKNDELTSSMILNGNYRKDRLSCKDFSNLAIHLAYQSAMSLEKKVSLLVTIYKIDTCSPNKSDFIKTVLTKISSQMRKTKEELSSREYRKMVRGISPHLELVYARSFKSLRDYNETVATKIDKNVEFLFGAAKTLEVLDIFFKNLVEYGFQVGSIPFKYFNDVNLLDMDVNNVVQTFYLNNPSGKSKIRDINNFVEALLLKGVETMKVFILVSDKFYGEGLVKESIFALEVLPRVVEFKGKVVKNADTILFKSLKGLFKYDQAAYRKTVLRLDVNYELVSSSSYNLMRVVNLILYGARNADEINIATKHIVSLSRAKMEKKGRTILIKKLIKKSEMILSSREFEQYIVNLSLLLSDSNLTLDEKEEVYENFLLKKVSKFRKHIVEDNYSTAKKYSYIPFYDVIKDI